jgi:hypothetical protein
MKLQCFIYFPLSTRYAVQQLKNSSFIFRSLLVFESDKKVKDGEGLPVSGLAL